MARWWSCSPKPSKPAISTPSCIAAHRGHPFGRTGEDIGELNRSAGGDGALGGDAERDGEQRVLGRHHRLATVDRVEPRLELHREPVGALRRDDLGALVVDQQRGLVVPPVREHAAAAEHEHVTVRERRRPVGPAHLADRHRAAGVGDHHLEVVVDRQRARGLLGTAGRHRPRRVAEPPGGQVEQVDAVVQRVAAGALRVEHPRAPVGPDPPAEYREPNELGLPDRACVDRLMHRPAVVVRAVRVGRHHRGAGRGERGENRSCIGDGRGERLLDQQVLAGGRHLLGDDAVRVVRRADDDRVHAVPGQRPGQINVVPQATVRARERGGPAGVGVHDTDRGGAGTGRQRGDVRIGDEPAADDQDADR